MVNLETRNDVAPICPHCNASLYTIWTQAISGFLGKRFIYFCPECRKVLGVSHRKGFWMG